MEDKIARKDRMSGNEAVSFAIRQINPDVMPAFPITPSTEIPQMVSTYIANGEIDTEFVPVESEHSAMSAAIGSEAAGARTLTATSSAGLALMWEELLLAASNRMPIALALVNRTLSGPININCDHSDGMGARDTGWIQIYAENNQEAYDNFIQAYPIAESAVGPYSVSNYAMEAKKNQEIALENAKDAVLKVAKEFKKISGRSYGLFEEYKTKDADYIMLLIGSAAGTAKQAVDGLRAKGKKVGVIKLRLFRPFPADELATDLKGAKAVAIMDRTESYNGNGGPLGSEVTAGLFRNKVMIDTVNYIYGLAGRDFTVQEVYDIFTDLEDHIENGTKLEQFKYIGLR